MQRYRVVGALGLLVACSRAQLVPTGEPVPARGELAPVCWQAVLVEYRYPTEGYREIGLLHAERSEWTHPLWGSPREGMLRFLRERAGRLGATRLVYGWYSLDRSSAPLVALRNRAVLALPDGGDQAEARAIVVPSDSARVREVCSTCEAQGMRTSWGTEQGRPVRRCLRDG